MTLWTRLKARKLVQWGLAYLAGAWVLLQLVTLLGSTYAWPAGLVRAVPVLLAVGFLAALVIAWYHGEQGRQRVSGTELLNNARTQHPGDGEIMNLFGELKRRRVYHVAIVYVGIAFVLAQVADIFFPGLHLPEWALTLVLVLLVMGFPLAVGLAWVFDITPAGVVRTAPAAGGAAAVPAGAMLDASAVTDDLMAPATATSRSRVMEHAPAPVQSTAPERSIAVLPFVNMSADPEQEYFSDGITEELLNVLAQTPELRVAARTSAFAFKNHNAPVDEIARKLKVAHVLEGSVRKGGHRVRITAQLIEAESGYHLWSQTYDRELTDIFAIQDEISREIATVLRVRLLGAVTSRSAPTTSIEAHNLYLKGRFHFNRMDGESLQKAIDHYAAALELDPAYAPAHAARAEAYAFFADAAVAPLEVLPHIEGGCRRALELDPDLAEAHALLGATEFNWGWDWEKGRLALRRALEISPNSASAHFFTALDPYLRGDYARALACMARAQQLDPLSPIISFWTELVQLWAGDYDAVIAQSAITQELAPGFVYHDAWVGDAYREKGMWDEALAAYRAAEPALGRPSSGLAVALVRLGRRGEAEAIADELARRFEGGQYLPPEFVARVLVALGRHDEAFRWLERGVEARSAMALTLCTWHEFAPLRDDPRWEQLMRRIGMFELLQSDAGAEAVLSRSGAP